MIVLCDEYGALCCPAAFLSGQAEIAIRLANPKRFKSLSDSEVSSHVALLVNAGIDLPPKFQWVLLEVHSVEVMKSFRESPHHGVQIALSCLCVGAERGDKFDWSMPSLQAVENN